MKKQFLLLLPLTQIALAKDLSQNKDIAKVVGELTYLIQVTKKLKHKYRRDTSKIRFNYDALIEQLEAARSGSKEYLNHELYELHTAPPKTKYRNHTKLKP